MIVYRIGVLGVSPDGQICFWKGGSEDVPNKEVKIEMGNDSVHSVSNLKVYLLLFVTSLLFY